RVAQPPDFQYFLDSTIGDSLRTDIGRQGNPNLGFEKGTSYEGGASHLFNEHLAVGVTAFRKNLDRLVTGSVASGGLGTTGTFSTSDFGQVRGLEFSLRARWTGITARGGWAIQKATGHTTGIDTDTALALEASRAEFPLAFDRRHSIDLALFLGRAGGAEMPWSAALTTSAQSGYPLFNSPAAADPIPSQPDQRAVNRYLPWTWTTDLRTSWDFGALGWCARCRWQAVADARNLFNRKNVIALRRENGSLAPSLAEVDALARATVLREPIPRESPIYSRLIDLNGDGRITDSEFRTARLAAAIDRYDPSLFYGEARQVRLGLEVVF
ncbi:MAG: TonB-dependent receptor, partial [Gemmatimonadota bacterium]